VLNERGITASGGGPWSAAQVSRLLARVYTPCAAR
jgi:hypothetical protein